MWAGVVAWVGFSVAAAADEGSGDVVEGCAGFKGGGGGCLVSEDCVGQEASGVGDESAGEAADAGECSGFRADDSAAGGGLWGGESVVEGSGEGGYGQVVEDVSELFVVFVGGQGGCFVDEAHGDAGGAG